MKFSTSEQVPGHLLLGIFFLLVTRFDFSKTRSQFLKMSCSELSGVVVLFDHHLGRGAVAWFCEACLRVVPQKASSGIVGAELKSLGHLSFK